jgi:hypothetical protein
MAKRSYIGGAATVTQQVWKGNITTTTTGHTYTLQLTDETGTTVTFSYALVGGDTTTTLAAASWAAAFNLASNQLTPTYGALSATSSSNTVILTARNAGVPFYPGTAGGTGTWASTGTTTANSGPADLNTAANYAEGVVPVASDDVSFISGDVFYGLQESAVFTGKVEFAPTFKGNVGSAGIYLSIAPSAFTCEASGTGSMWINMNSAAIALTINSTPAPSSGFGLNLLGSALTTVTVNGGSVAVANNAGETATITTIVNNGATVTAGVGTTLTNFTQSSGIGVWVGAATLTLAGVSGGTLTTRGTQAITTATVSGGTLVSNSTGTITTLNRLGGLADFMQSRSTRTVTNDTYTLGGIKFDPNVVTFTNGAKPLSGSGPTTWTAKAA